MKTDLKELRKELEKLYDKRDRGDLTERLFEQKSAELTVALYRGVIWQRMAESESIECEHHAIRTHFRLMQSILREPAQEATSLFLTNRKLYHLQSTVLPDQPPTADGRDNTSVEEISFDRIQLVSKKSQIRVGEILAGAGFCAVALVFYDWLEITGPVLVGLGALGVLHAMILPTRWTEVSTLDASPATEPIRIYAVRKKSAKQLERCLREKLNNL